jgi:hypothetical protein
MPHGGLLILVGLGCIGILLVWIAFLFNPSDDAAQKSAQRVEKVWPATVGKGADGEKDARDNF